jgi:predicted RNase H-like HicB family nuclease
VTTRPPQSKNPETEGIIILTSVVEEEGDQFVSICTELDTASCGDTIQEALDNLQEAIWVHLNALEETGERTRVFQERGIDILTPPILGPIHREIPVGKVVKATQHMVPAVAL